VLAAMTAGSRGRIFASKPSPEFSFG